jgi:hypothetical protein
MTQDEIIDIAVQAGMAKEIAEVNIDIVEAFAKLVAEKAFQNGYEKGVAAFNDAVLIEREACAELRNKFHPFDLKGRQEIIGVMNTALDDYQAAIRARGLE